MTSFTAQHISHQKGTKRKDVLAAITDSYFCANTLTNIPYVARVNGEIVGWGQKSQESGQETTTYSEKETVSNKQHLPVKIQNCTPTQVRSADLFFSRVIERRLRASIITVKWRLTFK